MAELIVYASFTDADMIRMWLNDDPDIAWVIKEGQVGRKYRWRAVPSLTEIHEGAYALWHTKSMRLNIPSGSKSVPDAPVLHPYQGWTQTLDAEHAETPWFGGNLPGPVHFRWRETGCERTNSLGRSGFSWLANRYASVGKPAAPAASRWWQRLKRFVSKNAVPIPWPHDRQSGKAIAYAFPEALTQIRGGRYPDANPCFGRAT